MPQAVYVIGAVLGFGFIVFIHELGHFLAAKLSGVKVKAFSLGFPPTVLHKKVGETDYRLGLIPVGGYVSMLGEEPGESGAAEDPRALNNAPRWKRAIIFLAGVGMNVLSAIVIYLIASTVGIEVTSPVVGGTAALSPARTAGLLPGDRILSIDGDSVESYEAHQWMVTYGGINDPKHKFEVRIKDRDEPVMIASTRGGSGLPQLGIIPPVLTKLGELRKGCPAAAAGLRQGDTIVAVNGTPVRFLDPCDELLRPLLDQPFTLTVERPTATVEIGATRSTGPQTERVDIQVDPQAIRQPDYGFTPLPRIGRVLDDSAAQTAGIEVGDYIVQIGSARHPEHREITRIIQAGGGNPIAIQVWRGGKIIDLQATPRRDDGLGYILLGVAFGTEPEKPSLVRAGKAGAATDAGIPDGSRIVSVAGKDTGTWERLVNQLDEAGGRPVEVTFQAPGGTDTQTVTVTPRMAPPDTFFVGADIASDGVLSEQLILSNPLKALGYGLTRIQRVVGLQYVTIKGMFTRQVKATQLMGPVRIGVAFYQTAEAGWGRFFSFLGVVSVAIALLNVMPLPPLDGGQVMFLVVEAISRRPIPQKVRLAVSGVGIVLLLGVVGLAFFNDGMWVLKELGR